MSLIPTAVVDALTARGVVVVADACTEDAAEVRVMADGTQRRLVGRRVRGAPTPALLDDLVAATPGPLLLVCDHISTGAARRADELGASILAAGPADTGVRGTLVLGTRRAETFAPPVTDEPVTIRVPRAQLNVLRAWLTLGRTSQRRLAGLAGVSQPRVSQAVTALALRETPPAHLLDRWLAGYPGPGGVATHWTGTGTPRDTALTAVRTLRDLGAEVAVSGDVGADLLAPWSRPMHAVVHASGGADLRAAGLVPVASAEATLTLVVPQDRATIPFAREFRSRVAVADEEVLPVADPLQVLDDLRRSPNVDRDQAAAALRRFVLARADATGRVAS